MCAQRRGMCRLQRGWGGEGDLTITGSEESERVYHYDQSSGFASKSSANANGAEASSGFGRERNEADTHSTYNRASVVLAEAGGVSIGAADDVTVTGSHLAAGEVLAIAAGGSVHIQEARETREHEESRERTFIGARASVSQNITPALESVADASDRASSGEGGTAQSAVTAASEALRTYQSVSQAVTNTFSAQVSVGYEDSEETLYEYGDSAYQSTLEAGGGVEITAQQGDVSLSGVLVDSQEHIAIQAGRDITIESTQDHFEQETTSESVGVKVSVQANVGLTGGSASIGASANVASSESQLTQTTQVNSELRGEDITLVSGTDTTIAGAVIEGDDITLDVGGDLTLASRQDISESRNESQSVGVSVSYGTNGWGGSLNVGLGEGEAASALVTEQTRILGEGEVSVIVGGHTQIDGAILAAVETIPADGEAGEAGEAPELIDSGRLTLSTGTLSVTDIEDEARSEQTQVSVGITYNDASDNNNSDASFGGSIDASHEESVFEQTTAGVIGLGQIEVRDEADFDASALNRDINQSQTVTRDEESSFGVFVDSQTLEDVGKLTGVIEGDSVFEVAADNLRQDGLGGTLKNSLQDVANDAEQIGADVGNAVSTLRDRINPQRVEARREAAKQAANIEMLEALRQDLPSEEQVLLSDPRVRETFTELFEQAEAQGLNTEVLLDPRAVRAIALSAVTPEHLNGSGPTVIITDASSLFYEAKGEDEQNIRVDLVKRNPDTRLARETVEAVQEFHSYVDSLPTEEFAVLQLAWTVVRSASPAGALANVLKEGAKDVVASEAGVDVDSLIEENVARPVGEAGAQALFIESDEPYSDHLTRVSEQLQVDIGEVNNSDRALAQQDVSDWTDKEIEIYDGYADTITRVVVELASGLRDRTSDRLGSKSGGRVENNQTPQASQPGHTTVESRANVASDTSGANNRGAVDAEVGHSRLDDDSRRQDDDRSEPVENAEGYEVPESVVRRDHDFDGPDSDLTSTLPPKTDYSAINHGPLGNPNDSTSFASTFRSGNYTDRTLQEDTVLYRVIPDDGNPSGAYWTSIPPQGSLQSVIDSALDQNWGNTATRVVRAKVPAGTRIFEGVAAPQRGLVGGGNQIVFDRNTNPFNPEWIISND